MAKSTGGLSTTMRGVPRTPGLRPPGCNTSGNSSKGFTKKHDCGPGDIPVVFDQKLGSGTRSRMSRPATMRSPMGPATGTPGRVRKTR